MKSRAFKTFLMQQLSLKEFCHNDFFHLATLFSPLGAPLVCVSLFRSRSTNITETAKIQRVIRLALQICGDRAAVSSTIFAAAFCNMDEYLHS